MNRDDILKEALTAVGQKHGKVLIKMQEPVVSGPFIRVGAYYMCSKCLAIKKVVVTHHDKAYNYYKSITDAVESCVVADTTFSDTCPTCSRYGDHDITTYDMYKTMNIVEVIKRNAKYTGIDYVGYKKEVVNGRKRLFIYYNCEYCSARNRETYNEFLARVCGDIHQCSSDKCCPGSHKMDIIKHGVNFDLDGEKFVNAKGEAFLKRDNRILCKHGHLTIVNDDTDVSDFSCSMCHDAGRKMLYKMLPKMKLPYVICDDRTTGNNDKHTNGLTIKVFTNYGRFAGIFSFSDPGGHKEDFANAHNLVHRRCIDPENLAVSSWCSNFVESMPYFIECIEKDNKLKGVKK